MTAEFFNQDPDDWKEEIKEAPNESLSQETSSVEQETLLTNLSGRVPGYCRECNCLYLLTDLTSCEVCGSSKLIPAEVIHYCHPCEDNEQDVRYKRTSKVPSVFEKVNFYIPCQKDAKADTPKPRNITGALNSVTCPKCLQAVGVPIGLYGKILWNEY